jgi:hypothetical protein
MNITEVEATLQEMFDGFRAVPDAIYTPEGCFTRDANGHLVVRAFDDDGNLYELSEEEQQLRRIAFEKRFG